MVSFGMVGLGCWKGSFGRVIAGDIAVSPNAVQCQLDRFEKSGKPVDPRRPSGPLTGAIPLSFEVRCWAFSPPVIR